MYLLYILSYKYFKAYFHLYMYIHIHFVYFIPSYCIHTNTGMCGKMKYGKGDGRKRRGQWIFGGISRTSGRFFMGPCPDNKRTRKALWPIIQVNILKRFNFWGEYNMERNICRQISLRARQSIRMA